MSRPFREATLSPAEVRRVLRRAAQIADRDPQTANVERPLTRGELESAAAGLGIPESAIARAFEPDDGAEDRPDANGSRLLGGKTRVVLERELRGEPNQAQREDLVDDIRDALGETGSVESVGNTLVWHAASSRNNPTLSVRLRFRDGRTRVVIEDRMLGQAVGLFVGLGVGGGVGPLGAYIAAVAKLGVVGLVFPLVWIPLMLLLARTIFTGIARRHARKTRELMRRIERSAETWEGTRIAVTEARVAAAEPLEPEEEAAPRASKA